MYCKKCGNQIDDDSVFCSHCGVKLNQVNNIKNIDEEKQVTSTNHTPSVITDKIKEDKMPLLPKALIKNKFLKTKKVRFDHLQICFLFNLPL